MAGGALGKHIPTGGIWADGAGWGVIPQEEVSVEQCSAEVGWDGFTDRRSASARRESQLHRRGRAGGMDGKGW